MPPTRGAPHGANPALSKGPLRSPCTSASSPTGPSPGGPSRCRAELDSARTLVLAFAATDYAERTEVWDDLGRAFPASHRLGCSSAGEILGQTVAEGSLVLAVVRFEHATVTSTAAPIQAVEVSRGTGGKIARVLAPHAPKLVFVVSDGLHVNGTDLVRGLAEGLPAGQRSPADWPATATVSGEPGRWSTACRAAAG